VGKTPTNVGGLTKKEMGKLKMTCTEIEKAVAVRSYGVT